jgi:hypothetical protein
MYNILITRILPYVASRRLEPVHGGGPLIDTIREVREKSIFLSATLGLVQNQPIALFEQSNHPHGCIGTHTHGPKYSEPNDHGPGARGPRDHGIYCPAPQPTLESGRMTASSFSRYYGSELISWLPFSYVPQNKVGGGGVGLRPREI